MSFHCSNALTKLVFRIRKFFCDIDPFVVFRIRRWSLLRTESFVVFHKIQWMNFFITFAAKCMATWCAIYGNCICVAFDAFDEFWWIRCHIVLNRVHFLINFLIRQKANFQFFNTFVENQVFDMIVIKVFTNSLNFQFF